MTPTVLGGRYTCAEAEEEGRVASVAPPEGAFAQRGDTVTVWVC